MWLSVTFCQSFWSTSLVVVKLPYTFFSFYFLSDPFIAFSYFIVCFLLLVFFFVCLLFFFSCCGLSFFFFLFGWQATLLKRSWHYTCLRCLSLRLVRVRAWFGGSDGGGWRCWLIVHCDCRQHLQHPNTITSHKNRFMNYKFQLHLNTLLCKIKNVSWLG